MYNSYLQLVCLLFLLFSACSTAFRPLTTEPVQHDIKSKVNKSLQNIPPPSSKVTAAVYRFRDQTGQYKPSNNFFNWSTAVTQGATSILIKSMEESGWFTPIERANISNLLNEREIISKTRQQNNISGKLPPLLFAGILLEGGVIGYDTNIITGGSGLRILGVGASGQFRKDQVSIYLRAVSTKNGRVLKTVHTTKSIISQQLESGAFLFVDTNTLLETEAGFTYNEPPVLAVTEAIEGALKELIIEGTEEGLWAPSNQEKFQQYINKFNQVKAWKEKAELDYFGLWKNDSLRRGFNLTASAIGGNHIGNFSDTETAAGASVQLETFISPQFSLKANVQRSRLGAKNVFSEPYTGFDGLLSMYLTPEHRLSPFVSVGAGALLYDNVSDFNTRKLFPAGTAEGGLDYRFSEKLGLRISFTYRYMLRDGLDGISLGGTNDQQWNVSTGLIFSPAIFN